MLKPEMLTLLNKQINHEMTAMYEYLAMAAWYESRNLPGFAAFYAKQSAEEQEHAMKIYQHVLDRDAEVEFMAIAAPRKSYGSVKEAAEAALALEQANTRALDAVHAAAIESSDYPVQSLMQWFADEQVEEESTASEILGMVELAAEQPNALLFLNRSMHERAARRD